MRLIDADAVKKLIRSGISVDTYADQDYVCELVDDIPTIDAVSVVHGEWVYCEDYVGQDGYKCSECGFFAPWHYNVYDIDYISYYHYCPNCGAKMDGERKTND